jgi:hypothetical protein
MLESASPFLGAFLGEPARGSGGTAKLDYH